jgi:hypothetical protein
MASIDTAGLLTCKNIDTTQQIYSRGIEVRDPLNATIASIVNTGWITCKNTDIAQTMYSRGIEIRNPINVASLTVDTNGKINTPGQIKTTGEVRCRDFTVENASSTATVSITPDGDITARNINVAPYGSPFPAAYMYSTGAIGGTSLTVDGLADIQNLKIAPSIVTDTSYIGYTYSVTSTTANYNSGNTRAIDLNNSNLVNNANYLVRYQVLLNSGTTSRNLTSIGHGLTNSGSTVTTVNGMKYEEGCFTYEKLNPGAEVINNRMFQGSFFYRYNSDNA